MSDRTGAITVDIVDRVATTTLNRPGARNAMNREIRTGLPRTMAALEADGSVDVIILTGADPAFCAGLDLKELGRGDNRIGEGADSGRPWGPMTKPVIGAINGVAITGGFELALACDFLIASDRAGFADTHARVGVMPGWGLTVLLPEAIGVRRAREMSLTGNFMGAEEALAFGLVNRVVAHDDLLPHCRQLADDIVHNDQPGVRQVLATYRETATSALGDGWAIEGRMGAEWTGKGIDPDTIEAKRQAIVERGRTQI